MSLYEKIQCLCKENEISIRQLERELGFGNNTIGKWKTSTPSIDKLQLVADYFGRPIEYFKRPGMYIGSTSQKGLHHLVYEVVDINKINTQNTLRVKSSDMPMITLDSKAAYDLVNLLQDMPEEDIEFLVDTAKRISPKKKKDIIVVPNPCNTKMPTSESMPHKKSCVPFPQYPTVTNKDIDEFAARNAKKKFTREEIAEMLHEMKQEDE